MIQKIVVFSIIFSFLITGFIVSAQQANINKEILTQGGFEAQLGLRRNDRPTYNLNGDYNIRGRIRIVSGLCTSSDIEGRFQGIFFGNLFFIKIPVRGGTQTIFGRIKIDDDHSTFIGSWNSRGIDNQGWISGEFITRD